jgi:hypothetical protein
VTASWFFIHTELRCTVNPTSECLMAFFWIMRNVSVVIRSHYQACVKHSQGKNAYMNTVSPTSQLHPNEWNLNLAVGYSKHNVVVGWRSEPRGVGEGAYYCMQAFCLHVFCTNLRMVFDKAETRPNTLYSRISLSNIMIDGSLRQFLRCTNLTHVTGPVLKLKLFKKKCKIRKE